MKKWLVECLRDVLCVGKWAALVGIPAFLLVSHVWTQYRVTKLGYEISEETSRHEELVERKRRLTIERRVQVRNAADEQGADEPFGLRRVTPDQFIAVDDPPVESEQTLADNSEPDGSNRP